MIEKRSYIPWNRTGNHLERILEFLDLRPSTIIVGAGEAQIRFRIIAICGSNVSAVSVVLPTDLDMTVISSHSVAISLKVIAALSDPLREFVL